MLKGLRPILYNLYIAKVSRHKGFFLRGRLCEWRLKGKFFEDAMHGRVQTKHAIAPILSETSNFLLTKGVKTAKDRKFMHICKNDSNYR